MNRPDSPREPSRLSGHLQKAEGAAAAFRLPPPIGQGIEHGPVSGDAGHVVTARHLPPCDYPHAATDLRRLGFSVAFDPVTSPTPITSPAITPASASVGTAWALDSASTLHGHDPPTE